MNNKASISHDEAMVRYLRANPDNAAGYLKAALEDTEEPRLAEMALRQNAAAGLAVDLPSLKTNN